MKLLMIAACAVFLAGCEHVHSVTVTTAKHPCHYERCHDNDRHDHGNHKGKGHHKRH